MGLERKYFLQGGLEVDPEDCKSISIYNQIASNVGEAKRGG